MNQMKKVFVILVLSLICSMFVVMNVYSQSREDQSYDREYYDELKDAYLSQVKEVMESHSCMNSGITFDFKCGEDGEMSYRLKVHHKRFATMPHEELMEIYAQLSQIVFWDEASLPVVEFV